MRRRRTDLLKYLKEENRLLRARLARLEQSPAAGCGQCGERYHALVRQAFDGVLLIEEETARVLEMTGALPSLLGRGEQDVAAGMPFHALFVDLADVPDPAALIGPPRELRLARKDGSPLEAEVRGVRFLADGRPSICLAVQDITERKRLEQALRHEATHDHLTGLANRKLFADRLQQEISYHRRRQKTLAVMVLDLDNFKQVNDNLGHRAGDTLLREFADRLRATVREYDMVARFGGDEFQIGLIDVGSYENVAYVARKLLDIFHAPFHVEGQNVDYVTGSIGIALYPVDGDDAEALFAAADAALYEAKRKGKKGFSFFRDAGANETTEPTRPFDTPPAPAETGTDRRPVLC